MRQDAMVDVNVERTQSVHFVIASGLLKSTLGFGRCHGQYLGSGLRRYGDTVDVERAADLYAQGWTLRQIGTELGLTETTVSD